MTKISILKTIAEIISIAMFLVGMKYYVLATNNLTAIVSGVITLIGLRFTIRLLE